jgi:hypothetical protein
MVSQLKQSQVLHQQHQVPLTHMLSQKQQVHNLWQTLMEMVPLLVSKTPQQPMEIGLIFPNFVYLVTSELGTVKEVLGHLYG